MNTFRIAALALALLPGVVEAQSASPDIFQGLGDHHYEITTRQAQAQEYFDQGLRLYYAFNHDEATRSFREAQRIDPTCAMCWLGEALAFGPNINLPMSLEAEKAGFRAVSRARELRSNASPVERGLIDAVALRYQAEPNPDHRARLDSAYSRALGNLLEQNPGNHEIAVLFAESVMDLRPWDYWGENGQLVPSMQRATALLEQVIESNPRHPGACHFYIHAVEEREPRRAVPCAERLADLMPAAGHLVHMPGHIYIRVGRYADAVRANEHAVHADETYIQDVRPAGGMYTAGYYPHNYDFMAFAAAMAGSADQAMASADQLVGLIPTEMLGTGGMGFLEHWLSRPLQMAIRFGAWDRILEVESPAEPLLHGRGMWHYAQGRAQVARGDLTAAANHLEALRSIIAEPAVDQQRLEFNTARSVLQIAEGVLQGRIEAARGNADAAIASLKRAVDHEDALTYGEPPEWSIPARHDLGAVLLTLDRAAEAERVFRADLDRFPDNGWSLYGLQMALDRQGRSAEARAVAGRLDDAWTGERGILTGWFTAN